MAGLIKRGKKYYAVVTVGGRERRQSLNTASYQVAKERLLEQFEAEYLRRLLERCAWQISQAAREAEIDRKHLYNLMRKYGIEQKSS